MRRVLLAAAVALVGLVSFAPAAGAHASLESAEPAAGAILSAAPNQLVLRFTEAVQVDDGAVRLVDATGDRIDVGDISQPERREVVVELPVLDAGGYVVAWKVLSADGHPVGGAVTWRIGQDSVAVDQQVIDDVLAGQTPSGAVGVTFGVVRFAVFGALLVLVGGALFVALLWPDGADRRLVRRLLWWSWGVLLAGTVLGIGLQGADLEGLGLVDALQPSVFADVLDTTFGTVWLARAALLLPVAWLLWQLPRATTTWWRVAAMVAGAVLVATPAFSGHADSGRWLEVAKALDVTHVGAAAVWLGGLAVLLLAVLRTDVTDARAIVERFSPVAFGAVAVVVVTGTGQAIRQITSLDQLETSYGRLLVVKVVLVLALIGVAWLTRAALHGRLTFTDDDEEGVEEEEVEVAFGPGAARAGEGDDIGVLRRLVGAEVVVALAVVAVTALLVDANPGYATTSSAGPFDETVVVEDVLVNVVVVPGTVGPTDVHLYVDDPAGGLAPPVDATGQLALPAREITGLEVPFVTAGPSHWVANDVDVPIAGEWELELVVFLTDVDAVTTTFTVPIGGSS